MESSTKSAVIRSFVTETHSSSYIKKGDLVLIILPEELEIHGVVDPMMSGRMGYVVSETNSMDVLIRLKKKRGEHEEFVTIPKFCLFLEETVLHGRKNEEKRVKKDIRRCLSDSLDVGIDLSSGGSSPSFKCFMLSAR